ncbi:flavodoxin domain-containing protein [Granulosicoccaceae sp. 1_MG-2023]|nr:flavodoxin domain-containing protein [Granulosicoccaceae sp. 1_MG-2023]
MAKVLIISGSVYGTATLVSDDIKAALEAAGHQVTHQEGGSADSLAGEGLDLALICTSTTGSGDVPANLMDFENALFDAPPRVAGLKYAVIALGDSSYGDSFCGAGKTLDRAMEDIGAVRVQEPLLIDAIEHSTPEDVAVPWAESLVAGLAS